MTGTAASEEGSPSGRILVSELVEAPVLDPDGRPLGRLEDLVVDLDRPGPAFPVTAAVVDIGGDEPVDLPVTAVVAWLPDEVRLGADAAPEGRARRATELLLRRDVLDAPVVLADPPRRTLVSDVVLSTAPAGPMVTGLDLSAGSTWRRLFHLQAGASGRAAQVPLSGVHLTSRHGHAAQIATPGSLVFRLGPHDMAQVLTRLSVARAREVVEAADQQVAARALELLHPHVRSRVTGTPKPRRRMLRLRGWRLHRPQGGSGGRAGTAGD